MAMRRLLSAVLSLAVLAGPLVAQPLTLYTEIAPPEQWVTPEGRLTGCSADLVREIQKRIGNTDSLQVVPWIRGYRELQTKPGIALFSMARTSERESLFEWVGPICENRFGFFVRSDSKITLRSLTDAKRLERIGVYKEDVRDQYLTRAGFTNLDRSLDPVIMFKKLMDRRLDAIASSTENIGPLAKQAGFTSRDAREAYLFAKIPLYIAFSKGTSSTVLHPWSKALDDMRRDGTFLRIYRSYHPDRPLPELNLPSPKKP